MQTNQRRDGSVGEPRKRVPISLGNPGRRVLREPPKVIWLGYGSIAGIDDMVGGPTAMLAEQAVEPGMVTVDIGQSVTGFGRTLAALPGHARPETVQVVVIADGHENASR